MAVVNTKSAALTALDNTPPKQAKSIEMGGRLRELVGTVEVAAADDNNSIYRFARVHSSWRVSSIEVFNDAIASGSSFDCGLYDTAENGGAVASATLFASAVSMTSARSTPTEITYEATAANIDKIAKALWELLGLSADPNKYYDIAMLANTVGTAAGTISLRVRYVDGS